MRAVRRVGVMAYGAGRRCWTATERRGPAARRGTLAVEENIGVCELKGGERSILRLSFQLALYTGSQSHCRTEFRRRDHGT